MFIFQAFSLSKQNMNNLFEEPEHAFATMRVCKFLERKSDFLFLQP
jgi:hypothetical protein